MTEKNTAILTPNISDNNTTLRLASQIPGSKPPQPSSLTCAEKEKHPMENGEVDLSLYRRTDFHWIVSDKNHLLWFSALLNRLSGEHHCPNLDIRIHPHLTQKLKNPPVSLHVYRCLLEKHRTVSQPVSPLTGFIVPTHFGRPKFPRIMDQHYQEMCQLFAKDKQRRRRVGVLFCGAPIIGAQLADLCHQLTLRGREEKTGIEYFFQTEVFG